MLNVQNTMSMLTKLAKRELKRERTSIIALAVNACFMRQDQIELYNLSHRYMLCVIFDEQKYTNLFLISLIYLLVYGFFFTCDPSRKYTITSRGLMSIFYMQFSCLRMHFTAVMTLLKRFLISVYFS